MHYRYLLHMWQSFFKKLGYRENEYNNLVFESEELFTVLRFTVDDKQKDFYIDIGIVIKKLHKNISLKEAYFEDHDIGQGMHIILLAMGEVEACLNNLFCYDPAINTDDEVEANVLEIARLYKAKVVPHILELDHYAWMVKDFRNEVSWAPFLKYFRLSPIWDDDF